MPGTGGRYPLVLRGITLLHGQRLLPILPILVFQQDRYGRADRAPLPHSGKDVGCIAFDPHASAAAIALLATPKFTVEESLINLQAGWNARDKGEERLAMRLTGGEVAQHEFWIVADSGENRLLSVAAGVILVSVLASYGTMLVQFSFKLQDLSACHTRLSLGCASRSLWPN